jgi:hypothetical protein
MVSKQSTTLCSKFNLHSSLTIFHQNIRRLKQKNDELLCMLSSINLNPYVVCFSEHYLTEQNLLIVNFSIYYLASNFSCINHSGGGVCIYIRSDLQVNTIDISQFCIEKMFEACAVQISTSIRTSIIVICIYRSPSRNFY